jgi:hypothetical protein
MYILVNIGCIECGVPSNIVGMFSSEKKAQDLAIALGKSHGWRHGGQNSFEVFPVPQPEIIADEYK